MSSRVPTLGESTCPVCGKLYYRAPATVYKQRVGKKLVYTCGWNCLTKLRKDPSCIEN